jgi:hypothetical protein
MQVLVEAAERNDELAGQDSEVLDAGVAEVGVLERDFLAGMLVLHLAGDEEILDQVPDQDQVEMVVVEEEVAVTGRRWRGKDHGDQDSNQPTTEAVHLASWERGYAHCAFDSMKKSLSFSEHGFMRPKNPA